MAFRSVRKPSDTRVSRLLENVELPVFYEVDDKTRPLANGNMLSRVRSMSNLLIKSRQRSCGAGSTLFLSMEIKSSLLDSARIVRVIGEYQRT